MICSTCFGLVEWKGPLSNLTHTECLDCGRINNQLVYDDDDATSAPSVPDDPSEIEELIACLGDDAAKLRQQNPDDEMAQIMEDAARKLRELDDALFCVAAPAPSVSADARADAFGDVLAMMAVNATPEELGDYCVKEYRAAITTQSKDQP